MDLLDDLDAYVGALEDSPEPPTMDDDLANRMLRRLRGQERERSRVVAVARAEREQIDAWERDRTEAIDRDAAGVRRMLEGYMRAAGERRGLRTLKLPNGELRLRPPRPSVTVTNEDDLRFWLLARANAGLEELGLGAVMIAVLDAFASEPMLRVKIEPARGEIAKAAEAGPVMSTAEDVELLAAVLEGGEVVPGVRLERATRDAFTLTLASAAQIDHDGDEPKEDE